MSVTAADVILVDADDAARRLSLARSSFYSLVRSGHLPQPVQIPGTTSSRWRVADLDEYVRNLRPGKQQPEVATS